MRPLPLGYLRTIATRQDALAAGLPVSTFYHWRRMGCDLPTGTAVRLAEACGLRAVLVHPNDLTRPKRRRGRPRPRRAVESAYMA